MTRLRSWIAVLALGALAALSPRAAAARPEAAPLPPAVRDVDIDEHLGGRVDPSLTFTDENGKAVRLGDYLGGGKPLVVVLAYYRCPMLCGLVLRGTVKGLKDLDYHLGEQYRAITVSFDPKDKPAAAREKQATTLEALGAKDRAASWPFVVGSASSSRALADELGFRFVYDAASDQYAHPAAIFVLTPDGRIARYLYGVDYSPRDLRLALLEASEGRIGSIVDRVLMTCYHFDPATRKYGPFVVGFMRVGGALILLTVGMVVGLLFWAERKKRAEGRS
ncbi:MAG TPA: SCO family protein [Minicystis sp.]|nr:SCO family protein [Minicystis sp.]